MSNESFDPHEHVALREGTINLLGDHACYAIRLGAPPAKVLEMVDATAEKRFQIDHVYNKGEPDNSAAELRGVAFNTSKALDYRASIRYIRNRLAIMLVKSGVQSPQEVAELFGFDLPRLRQLGKEMKDAQAEALRFSLRLVPSHMEAYGLRPDDPGHYNPDVYEK